MTDNRGHFVFDGIAVGRTYLISTSIKFDSADSVPCQKAVSGVGSPLSLARNPDRWPVAVRVENDGKFLEVVVSDEFEVTSRGALQKNVDLYCK